MVSALDRVRDALMSHGSRSDQTGRSWQCPAHEDRNPSLSVGAGTKGADVVLHCHAGCANEDVVAALGLTLADLYDEPAQKKDSRPVKVAEYPYCDENGELLYKVARYTPKTFRQFAADGTPSVKSIRRVPYRLPAVLAEARAGGLVLVVEGEKDVDNLAANSVVATCNAGGAGKWTDDHTRHLLGAGQVVVVADRDAPGRAHAVQVAESLQRAGITHRIVEPAAGKDISDHLAAGLGFDDLVAVERTAPQKNDSTYSTEPPPDPYDGFDGIDGTENQGGGAFWDDPIPVPTYRLPPFPTDALGDLAPWVRAQSQSLNVAEDLVAFSALAAISAATGGRRRVQVKDGWTDENVCLYLLGLAGSSARKTPALDAATAPIRERAGQLREDLRAEVEQNEQMIRITEAEMLAVERAVSQGKKDKVDAHAVLDDLRALRDKPGLPKPLAGDVTLEALGKLMGANGGRMAVLESEAGFFKACAGLYGNGRADITLILKAYTGTGHDIERVSRGGTWMPHTSLTIALIIQPGVVEHMEKDNPEFKSSGFLNRFLYCLPAPMPPGTFDTPVVPAETRDDYDRRIRRIFDRIWTAENISTMHLTTDARKRFADFYNEVEHRKAENGDLHDLAEWAGKLCGQIIRLAAVLALYDDHGAAEIGDDTMRRALDLAPYLIHHARAGFALMSRDGDGGRKLLRDILDRLRDLADDSGTVTDRKVRESFKGRHGVDAEAIREAMADLEDLGWVAEIPAPPRRAGQRGGKPSPKYDLHPRILSGAIVPRPRPQEGQ
ncbi:DUF3987 domain-containing protein [Kitasatospora indigofera]|uniref:DUF3987 domain-containing protein n=1 Tax=Kitasatospora indigofera TaxID=67307 RepID=UPI003668C970